MQRPTSISIIGWLFIVFAALGLLGTLMMSSNPIVTQMLAQSPLPLSVHVAIGFIGSLISAACGYGVLKGMSWSRFLYLGWTVASTIFNFGTMPVTSLSLFGLVIPLAILFFLFRPAANEWFRQGAPTAA
jgi:hypothetical protein